MKASNFTLPSTSQNNYSLKKEIGLENYQNNYFLKKEINRSGAPSSQTGKLSN